MTGWKIGTLREACNISTGFAFKGGQYESSGSLRVVRGENVTIGALRWDSEKHWNHSLAGLENYLLAVNDIVIGMDGSRVGQNRAKIRAVDLPLILAQRVARLRAKEGFNQDFIWYQIIDDRFKDYVEAIHTGTSIPHISMNQIADYDVSLPPLPEQKAIAAVLSSLDDKIDLLHRQNKTLEAMAATLFRQWFVEETQVDWEEVVITDLFEVRDGTHDSPKQTPIGKPLITSKHILDGQLDIDNAYLISVDDFNQVNQRSKVSTGDILFSMIGTIGLIYLEQSPSINYAIKNIGLFKASQNPDWTLYTYLWLRSSAGRQFIDEHKSGSTQEYVALGSLRSITFQKPHIDVLQEFNKLASPYFSKIILNRSQIRTLEKLRDTLLPKLMSGEVRVA